MTKNAFLIKNCEKSKVELPWFHFSSPLNKALFLHVKNPKTPIQVNPSTVANLLNSAHHRRETALPLAEKRSTNSGFGAPAGGKIGSKATFFDFFQQKFCRYKNYLYICTTKNDGAIAQLVEQRTENPCVPGSIPGGTTLKIKQLLQCNCFFFMTDSTNNRGF